MITASTQDGQAFIVPEELFAIIAAAARKASEFKYEKCTGYCPDFKFEVLVAHDLQGPKWEVTVKEAIL